MTMKIYMLIVLLGTIATFAHISSLADSAVKREPSG